MASAAHRPVHRPPRLPDRYVPIRRIAAGGTATVWCAEDLLLGRRVAIKLLAQPYASDHEAVRRFTREARAAARLSGHPHVVTIYDVGETEADDGPGRGAQPFIVMEHLSGGTVADALRVRAVTADDAVRWLHEAAQALDFAHAKGVLHRDIKPANLLLDRGRRLHVADFGIAQLGWEDTLASTGHVLGTASYLAPERVLARPASVASDLYGLAVTAFELLTGQLPFPADSYLVQARMHVEQEPPAVSAVNPGLPGRLDEVLARGLAKDPEQRWPSAEAFATALSDAMAPVALAAPQVLDSRAAAVSRARRALSAPARPSGRAPVASRPRTERVPVAGRPRTERPKRHIPKQPRRPRPTLGLLAATATVLTLGLLGFAWAQSLGAPAPARRAVHLARASHPALATHNATRSRQRSARAPARKTRPKPAAPSTSSTVQAVQASAQTPAAGADALEARGHALLASGQYAQAIEVLHKALASAAPSSLTYAYALYDLGRALLLSGHPADAARVLYQRLQIPNQTGLVRATLLQALQELAGQAKGSGPGIDLPPGAGHRHHGPGDGPGPGPGGAGGAPGGDGGAGA